MPLTITIPNPDGTGEPVAVTAFTIPELAAHLGYHPETVRRYAAAELWPHLHRGRRVLFTEAHRQAILASLTDAHDYPAHTKGHG